MSKTEAIQAMFDGKAVKHESGLILRIHYGKATSQILLQEDYDSIPEGTYEVL